MNPVFIVLLALGLVALLVWALTHRHTSPYEESLEELPIVGDIKPRIHINHFSNDDPCRPLDEPDIPTKGLERKAKIGDWIRIINLDPTDDMNCAGSVMQVTGYNGKLTKCSPRLPGLLDREFEVLEGYIPPLAAEAPEIPSVVTITPNPKMTRADALKAANRNRQAEGRLKAQKAKEALDAKEDPVKVAADCGYKKVKYMMEKVRELEREDLPE